MRFELPYILTLDELSCKEEKATRQAASETEPQDVLKMELPITMLDYKRRQCKKLACVNNKHI